MICTHLYVLIVTVQHKRNNKRVIFFYIKVLSQNKLNKSKENNVGGACEFDTVRAHRGW